MAALPGCFHLSRYLSVSQPADDVVGVYEFGSPDSGYTSYATLVLAANMTFSYEQFHTHDPYRNESDDSYYQSLLRRGSWNVERRLIGACSGVDLVMLWPSQSRRNGVIQASRSDEVFVVVREAGRVLGLGFFGPEIGIDFLKVE